ncbi:MAG: phosphatase PAP2 family protein [Bacteroidetes bacterium]|nr:phosphatase PAP2 family protein [Bacteroidota bacterium]
MNTRLKNVGHDFKRLFVEWGEYYSIPRKWQLKQWLILTEFLLLIFIAAYFDESIRYYFLTIHGPIEDKIAGFVHIFGTGKVTLYLFLIIYIAGVLTNWEKVRAGGLMIAQSFLYSGLITIALKSLVGRWRPNQWHGHLTFSPLITGPNAYLSFPSGDAAVAFALAIVMAGFFKNWLWKFVWILIAVLTCLSRIYYNAHWFSDILFSSVNATVAGVWLVRRYHAKYSADTVER